MNSNQIREHLEKMSTRVSSLQVFMEAMQATGKTPSQEQIKYVNDEVAEIRRALTTAEELCALKESITVTTITRPQKVLTQSGKNHGLYA